MKQLYKAALLFSLFLPRSLALAAPIHEAAIKGDLAEVRNLLTHGATLAATNSQGETVLHLAVKHGHKRIVNFLLTHEVNVNAQTLSGDTPLHYAAETGQPEFVEVLLAHGANVHARNRQHWTFLPLAGGERNTEIVKFLSVAGEEEVAGKNRGETPLHRASQSGNEQTVRALLTHGADVNARSMYNGQSPLHLAAANGNPAVLALLLAHGADIDVRMAFALTPTDDVKYLLTPLHLAVLAARIEATKILLAASANVNERVQAEENATLLSADAYAGDFNRLTELGSLANCTPLHLAAVIGRQEVVETLLAQGAQVNATDTFGRTPLHFSSLWNNNVTVAEHLLTHGATVDARDRDGATPLQTALLKRRKSLAELLLVYGADPKTQKERKQEVKSAPVQKQLLPVRTLLPTERSW